MVSKVDLYHNDAQRVAVMDPKYHADSSRRSGDVTCATKLEMPFKVISAASMQEEPAVNTTANFCGARSRSGIEANEAAISITPMAMSTKNIIHC
mmetsp:Transcript_8955/g.15802  ORF Transcript_8955/g.15802 Transcript_8955/m.15802 type:complete len:95 (+) Transcript_8955:201-485(+)